MLASGRALEDVTKQDDFLDTDNLGNYYQISGVWECGSSRSRNTRTETIDVMFHDWENAVRPEFLLEACIESLMGRVLADRPPPLRIGMSCQPADWEHPFHIPLRSPTQNTPAALAAGLENFATQSADGIDLFSGNVRFKFSAVWPIPANENSENPDNDSNGACAGDEHEARADGTIRCRSFVPIINPDDNFCMARAIVIGLAHVQFKQQGIDSAAPQVFRAFCASQQREGGLGNAQRLLQNAGVSIHLARYGVREAAQIQRYVDEKWGAQLVRIVVLDRQRVNGVAWKGEQRAEFNLCIVHTDGHYGYISRPEQLFNAKLFCVDCERTLNRHSHTPGCAAACTHCLRYGFRFPCRRRTPEDPASGHLCDDCGFVFANRDCLDAHRRQVDPLSEAEVEADRRRGRPHRSLCEERRHCAQCRMIVWARAGPHRCRPNPAIGNGNNNNNDQQQQQPQQAVECEKCSGPHNCRETPCFIQPTSFPLQLRIQAVNQQRANFQGQMNEEEDDFSEEEDMESDAGQEEAVEQIPQNRRKQKPLRYVFWDAECAQEQTNNDGHRKHVPLLICAEVICERCIAAGVHLEREPLRRAEGCFCGVPLQGVKHERWAMPIGADAFEGEELLVPVVAPEQMPRDGRNPRRLHFVADANATAIAQFTEFLLHNGPQNICTMLLAHNGGRYDAHLLLEEFHRLGIRPKRLISHGLRIYALHHGGHHRRQLIAKDTLNFFGCALGALPSAFGLQGVADKPYFPYAFISRQNMDVELDGLPPLAMYEPDEMKEAKRAEFLRWYEEQQQRRPPPRFQLRRELLRYCSNDVRILREATLRFRHIIGQLAGGMEPFVSSSTIAGLALAVFRQCHLRRDVMRHTPEGGFLRGRRASAASRRFFAFVEKRVPEWEGAIRTAQWAIGEAGVEDDGYRLDGLVHRHPPLRPLAIEFNGCYFHGCPQCYPQRQMRLAGGLSAELLFARTQQRAWELTERHGMEVQTVWECEFEGALRRDRALRQQYTAVARWVPEPLDLRKHALYGGRVEPFCLNISCPDGFDIHLYDIVSQYPDVMKNCRFPVGMPRVLSRESLIGARAECPHLPWRRPADNPYRGFILCRVLPPTAARLGAGRPPLLPYRLPSSGCLTFPLCRSCAEAGDRRRRRCRHNDDQRSWMSGYTHAELNAALTLGYTVIDLWEVWHYEEWSASPEDNDGVADSGLFSAYINTFMRLKAEASGWPADCRTAEQRAQFVRQYLDSEGIQLDPERIEENPSLRKIAKSLLTALWGKFAQRAERDEIRYTASAHEFHKLLADPQHEVVSFTHVHEHLDRCVVRKRGPFVKAPETNNLAVACFVTSYGRLSLYRRFEEVLAIGGRLLYCDTDSVMYMAPTGAPAPASAGDTLGKMKRELPGRRITEFFAGGPKNYGYLHVDAQTGDSARAERKIRGIQLNYSASRLITFEQSRQLVLNHFGGRLLDGTEEMTITVPYTRFVRNKLAHIYTRHGAKMYRPVYTKGIVNRAADDAAATPTKSPTIWTCPFGGWYGGGGGEHFDDQTDESGEEDSDSEVDELFIGDDEDANDIQTF